MERVDQYINQRSLIVGDVNTGKTERTREILRLFLQAGLAKKVFILDFAPGSTGGIGHKMIPPPDADFIYLTSSISAPRLLGKDDDQILKLAKSNAKTIEGLFIKYYQQQREILFVNDVTLYFHAGDFEKISQLLYSAPTVVINAYYGRTFPDSELTRREKKLTQDLMNMCDRVITMPTI